MLLLAQHEPLPALAKLLIIIVAVLALAAIFSCLSTPVQPPRRRVHPQILAEVYDKLSDPYELPAEVLKEGNPACQHRMINIDWNNDFGPAMSDRDPSDYNQVGALAFPMATYKSLSQCQCGCGRLLMHKTRALY